MDDRTRRPRGAPPGPGPGGRWHAVRVPRFVHAAPGVTLWAQTVPGPATDPVLLVADAGASLALWPEPLSRRSPRTTR